MALSLGEAEMLGHMAPGASPKHTGISLLASDIRATFADLKLKFATIIKLPEDMGWVSIGSHFADPDGSIFFVVEGG